MMNLLKLFVLAPLIAGGTTACSQRATRVTQTLPFVVRVNPATLAPTAAQTAAAAAVVTPLDPEAVTSLDRRLAQALRTHGVFSEVVLDPADSTADLELDITLSGGDFGAGAPSEGAVLSTITWLFLGHLSFVVEDRKYPDADLLLRVTLRQSTPAAGRSPSATSRALWAKDLDLDTLSLSPSERFELTSALFTSVFVPPFLNAGDPREAGASLSLRAIENFAEQLAKSIPTEFPAAHLEALRCFLVAGTPGGDAILVARRTVQRVSIADANGKTIQFDDEKLALEQATQPRDRQSIRRILSRKDLRIGANDEDRFYRLTLPDNLQHPLRVEARMKDDDLVARWTIIDTTREND